MLLSIDLILGPGSSIFPVMKKFEGFPMEQNNIYAFGPYRLDTATQILWDKETESYINA